jgi:hypothetical protein
MKRFTLVVAVVVASIVFSSASVNAAGGHGRHGYAAYPSYTHGYSSYGHSLGQVYGGGHGYAAPVYRHGVVRHGYSGYGYGGHGSYGSYGHGGGIRISTPHFGFQIGH